MPSDQSGPAYKNLEAFPQTNFVDGVTVGFDNVKSEKNVKLLRMSAPSSSLLCLKMKNYSDDPSNASKAAETHEHCNKFRHAVLYSTVGNLTNALSNSAPKFNSPATKPPKLCFLVTCQATQYAGMGRDVYSWSPIFRRHFDACDAVIKEDYGLSVKSLMESEDGVWVSNPLEALPYILSLQYALSKLWESWGIKPDIVLGMSFGEYGAAVMSGIISLRDAVRLVMTRTKLVTDHIWEEAFAAVEMDSSEFAKTMEEVKKEDDMQNAWVDIACVNSPLQTCVVGLKKYVHKFAEICKRNGKKCFVMDPYHPYHSRLTLPVIPQFEEVTSQVEYKKPSNGTFISTVRNGRIMKTLDKDYYLEHLQGAALFVDAIRTVLNEGDVTHFLEVGPHPINTQMVKDILQNGFPEMGTDFEFYSSLSRMDSDKLSLLNTLGRLYTAGFNIKWENVNVN